MVSLKQKVERTTSLRLIHTYSVDDPAGLRRPELGATGDREEGGAALQGSMDIGSTREERGAAQGQDYLDKFTSWGVPLLVYL